MEVELTHLTGSDALSQFLKSTCPSLKQKGTGYRRFVAGAIGPAKYNQMKWFTFLPGVDATQVQRICRYITIEAVAIVSVSVGLSQMIVQSFHMY